MTKSTGKNRPKAIWTYEKKREVMRRYPHEKTESIAASIGMRTEQVYRLAKRLGLKKTDEYMSSPDACRLRKGDRSGELTRFKKGNAAWNKGMKGLNIGGKETQFTKGHRGGKAALLYKPIGTTRVSKDGYLEQKTNDDFPLQKRWKAVHRIVWEQNHGPIPAGHIVRFKQGMRTIVLEEITIDRLEMLSQAENMRMNSYHTNYPKEIGLAIQLKGQITRQINQRKDK